MEPNRPMLRDHGCPLSRGQLKRFNNCLSFGVAFLSVENRSFLIRAKNSGFLTGNGCAKHAAGRVDRYPLSCLQSNVRLPETRRRSDLTCPTEPQ